MLRSPDLVSYVNHDNEKTPQFTFDDTIIPTNQEKPPQKQNKKKNNFETVDCPISPDFNNIPVKIHNYSSGKTKELVFFCFFFDVPA